MTARGGFWGFVFAVSLVGIFPMPAAAQAGEDDPFASEDDPFAEDATDDDRPAASGAEGGQALPPPTVPEGYGAHPQTPQPSPQTPPGGYPQPAQSAGGIYVQPGYPAQPPPPRLQRAPYVEGMELPEGARIIEKRRSGLLIAGAAMFGVSYITSVSIWAESTFLSNWMLVPVLGPFVETGNDSLYEIDRFILVLGGLVQTAGLTLFVLGLASKRRFVEYYGANEPGWRVGPSVAAGGGRIDLSARF